MTDKPIKTRSMAFSRTIIVVLLWGLATITETVVDAPAWLQVATHTAGTILTVLFRVIALPRGKVAEMIQQMELDLENKRRIKEKYAKRLDVGGMPPGPKR